MMNVLVARLSKEAMDYAAEQYGPQRAGEKVWDPYTFEKKFAELIVRECLTIADKEHKMALEFEWDNDDTAQSIKDSIKKHFGVEE